MLNKGNDEQRGGTSYIAQDLSIEQLCKAKAKRRFAATKRISSCEFMSVVDKLRTMQDSHDLPPVDILEWGMNLNHYLA